MKLVLTLIFSVISFSSYGYHKNNIIFDEEEIICIATYELAEEFFLQMKDPNTSEEMKKRKQALLNKYDENHFCLLYTSPSPRDQRGSRMPSSA